MLKHTSFGLMAAAMLASLGGALAFPSERPTSRPSRRPSLSPNDHGPVIDTTKESKRARRRRLAKANI